MSLALKLYRLGSLVTKNEIKEIIELKEFSADYTTIQIDFSDGEFKSPSNSAVDRSKNMFTKKIGGTSNSYYLYPNFEYQDKKDLLKKFKSAIHTFENSIMVYATKEHQQMVQPIIEKLKNYTKDVLELSNYDKGNYFLIFTIDGKTLYELMPEVWDNYYDAFVDPHISKKVKGNLTPQLSEEIDFVTLQKGQCGYNPSVKFFTMDNYNDAFKPQIINKLPMTKETAKAIKKGWMYAITHLRFFHKGLEYIIIPSMVAHDDEVYKKLITFLKRSKSIKHIASKENSFMRRLSKQIEEFDNAISLDILFTEVNTTNLSVKILSTLEDVLPSRIRHVVKTMQDQKIYDELSRDENKKGIYLKEYFSRDELFAIATKNLSGMKNKIIQEKIYLAKLLLGYEQISHDALLKKFEHEREFDYENNKRLSNMERKSESGTKEVSPFKTKTWLNYPSSYINAEDSVLKFLHSINAIKKGGQSE